MEKLTISRVGTEKEISTKFGKKFKTGVQFKEYGDVWHDIWRSGLKVGDVLEGTRESRDYQGKTYWDFKLPKKDEAMNFELTKLQNQMTSCIVRLSSIESHLGIKTASDYKNIGANAQKDTTEYPEEVINPEDIPF